MLFFNPKTMWNHTFTPEITMNRDNLHVSNIVILKESLLSISPKIESQLGEKVFFLLLDKLNKVFSTYYSLMF